MTRVNVVPPEALSRQHLVAEYRELPRIFGLAARAMARDPDPQAHGVPPSYVLGGGHVKFFYPRQLWLVKRHGSLVREMEARGYAANIRTTPEFLEQLARLDARWTRDWTPTAEALRLNLARIAERGGLRDGYTPEEILNAHA